MRAVLSNNRTSIDYMVYRIVNENKPKSYLWLCILSFKIWSFKFGYNIHIYISRIKQCQELLITTKWVKFKEKSFDSLNKRSSTSNRVSRTLTLYVELETTASNFQRDDERQRYKEILVTIGPIENIKTKEVYGSSNMPFKRLALKISGSLGMISIWL